MYQPTANDYFAGAGGLAIGLMQSGIKILQSIDLDQKATNAMLANPQYFGGHKVINGDISTMTVLDQPQADIYSFTYPCTKYSAIADIHGTRTGDELFLHALRHIALVRPEMYVIENVPGMKKFKVVMETMTKLPDYYITVFCPVEATNWLPQRRDRLIVIATRKPFTINAPAPEKAPTVKDLLENDPKIHIPDCLVARLNGKYRDKPIIVDPNDPGAIAPTCVAHYMKDLGTRVVIDKNSPVGVRPFTIREYARLQGFPDDYKFNDEVYSYKLIGNAVAVPVGRWIGEQAVKYFNNKPQPNKKG
jgi:DNA (cytosine-5)-methyltransferase 1